jgi:hypothetical protein
MMELRIISDARKEEWTIVRIGTAESSERIQKEKSRDGTTQHPLA